MAIETVMLTPAEQKLIQDKRNDDCMEGRHLQGVTKLPNGRICHYCTNCLWAEPTKVTGPAALQIGSISLANQMKSK